MDKGGEKPTLIDQQLEDERRQLERECTLREFKALRIEEEQPMSQDDEKCPMSVSSDDDEPKDYITVSQR